MSIEIEELRRDIKEIKETQSQYIKEHHKLELDLVSLKADINYIKSSQDSLNNNLTKILWIFGGGIIAAAASFVVKGGLAGG
tara:strand:+ start:813 stop:1058 length:246 start_codon:yes stop_codon:yes gene_type:complete